MNYYFLPGSGIYGGIKVGYQFAMLIDSLGAPCIMVTPDGRAPSWFHTDCLTISEDEAVQQLADSDTILFSFPYDYERLSEYSSNLVFHCQGTDPVIDPIILNHDIKVLTCWRQAADYVMSVSGRASINVGISISDAFYNIDTQKTSGTVSYMPRRGNDLVLSCREMNKNLKFTPIDNMPEDQVAAILLHSEYYLATSVNEWFGLPALEAMAAGCVVLSVPTIGGTDYLIDNINSRVVEPDELARTLYNIASETSDNYRDQLREHARITASTYRLDNQYQVVAGLLDNSLSFLRS